MNPKMFKTGFYPMPKLNQRAFFPPEMTQMRRWGQPSINRPYNVPVQQRRGRGNVPCASVSGRMGARTTIGIQQRNRLAQNQAVQRQQAAAATAAKLKFNANARNQPEGIVAGSQAVYRAQGIQVL